MEIENGIFLYQNTKYRHCLGCLQIFLPTETEEDFKRISKLEFALSKILYAKGYEIIGLYLKIQSDGSSILQVLSYEVNTIRYLNIPLDDYQQYEEIYFEYKNNATIEQIETFNNDLVNSLKKEMKVY